MTLRPRPIHVMSQGEEADVGEDVEKRDDEEDGQQGADDEVRRRGIDPLGPTQSPNAKLIPRPGHGDELVETGGGALDAARPREAREQPGDDDVERGEDPD